MSDITTVIEHHKNSQDRYLEAADYFNGTIPEKFTSERLRRALSNSQVNPVLNFAATPVTAVADRLEITGVSAGETRGQSFIDQLWDDNELAIEANDAHLWSLVYGDGYLMVWEDPDTPSGYTINYNTPLTTAIFYENENPRRKRFASKMWAEGGFTRLNLYYPGEVHKFISKTKDKVQEAKDLKPYIDEDTDDAGVMVSPFDFVPVFHLRTRKPYGEPEHKASYGAQDLITKNVISQMVANDFHGLPQRYVLSDNTNDGFSLDEDADPELTAGAGEVWFLDNVKAVGQFDAAEPASYLEPFREYVRSIASLTKTPLHHFEAGFSAPSGESLRVAEAPLVKKCRMRASLFGSVWVELFHTLLEHESIDDSVTVSWKTIESVSEAETWQKVKAMRDAGLTLEQALRHGTNLNEEEILQITGTMQEVEA